MEHQIKNIKFVQSLTWDDVFEIWRSNEEQQEGWIELYTKRGFKSWQDWRQSYVEFAQLNELEWNLFEIQDFFQTVPKFFGGPFRGWIKNMYGGKQTLSFLELAELGAIKSNRKVLEIINDFPKDTIITGLNVDGRIFIVEGMHRCCAAALMSEEGRELNTSMYIALANYPEKELPEVGSAD